MCRGMGRGYSAFDPRGKQLDVVLPTSAHGNGSMSSSRLVQRLQSYGFSLADAQKAAAGVCTCVHL
jgi:hypothetical protein